METENAQHYKMISSVEYTGEGQFRNQAETSYTVRQETLPNGRVQYSFYGNDGAPGSGQESSLRTFDFILDRETRQLSGVNRDMAFWARVNNECVRSLQKVTKNNVGKTWKQSFALSSFDTSLPGELAFTLTAIELETDQFGQMIAVRALSEPFLAKVEDGFVTCKVNTIYLFDPEIEEIYLSISTFAATTNANGHKETLRYEVATYRSNATGASVNLSGLGKDFEKFVQKVGLSTKVVKVTEEMPLPQWAQSEGLVAAQVATICGAMACEGAPNPVVTVCIPAAQTIGMQSTGLIPSMVGMGGAGTVAGTLGQTVPGIGTMKIAMAPAFLGLGLGTAGTVASGTAIAGGLGLVIENNSHGSGRSHRSPIVP
ncbi:MAG: hypothetical protein ISS70_00645 [Phycisphaerae bacterium]|nr:hypothetical protein [Phycisphaerae bacterium]